MNVCLVLQSTSLLLWERIFEMVNTSLKQSVSRIPLLMYRCMRSFPPDFVTTLPNDTFAIINTQPSNTPGEHWIMITKFHHELYFADSLGLSINNYPFLKQKYSQIFSDNTLRSPQCMRFLHNLCSISFVQVSTRGDNWCS